MEEHERWRIEYSELKFEKQLGRGSFGEVWKGERQGCPVAIKKLYDKPELDKYFEREIDALTQLSHPYIVQLLGMAITADAIYIVTEYVETGDLHSKLIDPAHEFNWKRKLTFLKDICRAMIFLHNKGQSSLSFCPSFFLFLSLPPSPLFSSSINSAEILS